MAGLRTFPSVHHGIDADLADQTMEKLLLEPLWL